MLNRYTVISRIGGSNPPPSASLPSRDILFPAPGADPNAAECGRLRPSIRTTDPAREADFAPFSGSLTPLSLTQLNHARFGTDVRSQQSQRFRGNPMRCGFEGRPLKGGRPGSNYYVRCDPVRRAECEPAARSPAPGWRARAVPHVGVVGCQHVRTPSGTGSSPPAPATPPPQSPDRRCRTSRSAHPRQLDLDHAGGLYSSQLRARVTGHQHCGGGVRSRPQ